MLSSLHIQNFRNLNDLKIEGMKRVNLFTGKNNVGKSVLLEALSVYASRGDFEWLNQLLRDRGERLNRRGLDDYTEQNAAMYASLFRDRLVSFAKDRSVRIGPIESDLFGDVANTPDTVTMRFVKYKDELDTETDPSRTIRRRKILPGDSSSEDGAVALQIGFGGINTLYPLSEQNPARPFYRHEGNGSLNFQFIRTKNIDRIENDALWDNITLSPKEDYVIKALRIIEPFVERIAFVGSADEAAGRTRRAVVKTRESDLVIPIRSMGDGMNRILSIVLACVNSDKGMLLLDEFENGLHYTVQESLWKLVFELSFQLGIQVFATTHSSDCVAAFTAVLNSGYEENGMLARLENSETGVQVVPFTAEELRIATGQDIETR